MTHIKLNKPAAEKVMGWMYHPTETFGGCEIGEGMPVSSPPYYTKPDGTPIALPDFCTSIADAWMLVGRMRGLGWYFVLTYRESGDWSIDMWEKGDVEFTTEIATTAPLAITKACLKAMGVEL